MSAAERAEAMALLTAPDLMDRILADFALCGVVGEAVNIQTGYLACVSRLLDRPLAIIIQSSSAAGKSAMMDAVLRSEEHTSELQSLMRISYAVFCLNKKKKT